MEELTDIIINGEIKEVLGLNKFKAYKTMIYRVEKKDDLLLVGVYGPSDSKNFYELNGDQLPDNIHTHEYIKIGTPVISVYQRGELIGIIKMNIVNH